MKIIIDSREADLYEKCENIISTCDTNTFSRLFKKPLDLGDVYVTTDGDMDICIIERKTLKDLLSSIKDGRYEEQSHRLANATHFHKHNIIYLIEGMTNQLNTFQEKKILYSAMTSLQYYKGFSVIRTSCLQETAEFIVWFSDKIDKNFLNKKQPFYLNQMFLDGDTTPLVDPPTQPLVDYSHFVKKVKKENITPENIGQIILSQIPGTSDVSATAIMQKFKTIKHLLSELEKNPDCLNDVTITTNGKTRKIGKNVISGIKTFLL